MKDHKTSSYALLKSLDDSQLAAVRPSAYPILFLSLFAVVAFFVWAYYADMDEFVRGHGTVIPVSRVQKIQSLEGGILKRMLVKEGDLVDVGQTLIRIDDTKFNSAFKESKSKTESLIAAISRLEAETLNRPAIVFPRGISASSKFAASEVGLFKARRSKYQEAIKSLNSELEVVNNQLKVVEPLISRQSASVMEGLRLKKEVATINGKITEVKEAYFQEAYKELSEKRAELNSLEQGLLQREDQLQRTDILSPVKGLVNNIMITTQGGVIQPGEPIMEITPIDDQLLIEAKVKPSDVAFLIPGMAARVKITAYDYTVYGDFSGVLEQISSDTIEEETPRGREPYYKVLVRTQTNYLKKGNEKLEIKPGMVAEVDIQRGKRTVLNYLLRPILKANLR